MKWPRPFVSECSYVHLILILVRSLPCGRLATIGSTKVAEYSGVRRRNTTSNVNYGMPAPNGPFFINSATSITAIADGTSNTAMVSEASVGSFNASVPNPNNTQRLGQSVGLYPANPDEAYQMCESVGWQNLLYNGMSNTGAPWIYGYHSTTIYFHVGPPNSRSCMYPSGRVGTAARSSHVNGVNVALRDGSVRFVQNSIPLTTWRAMGSMNGGEVVSDQ
jgi:hypothetical protein